MQTQFLDTRSIVSSREKAIAREIESIRREHKITPKIGILLVTGDQTTMAQVDKVISTGEKIGFSMQKEIIAERTVDRSFTTKLRNMSGDDSFMGIWVVTPRFDFPPYDQITEFLSPQKDIAGIHHSIFGRYMFGKPGIIPPKVRAVHEILEEYIEGYEAKGIVIISTKNDGTRGFFGKYLAGYLYDLGTRVTLRNVFGSSKIKEKVVELYNPFGEVVVTALNTSKAVMGDRLKPGSIVIDTGYNFQRANVSGDVDIQSARGVCAAITPVPGGVDGLIPVCVLLNALDIVKAKVGIPRVQPRRDRFGRTVR